MPTGAKAHSTEAKHNLENVCIVAHEDKAQNYSKRHWLLTFYLDERVPWFIQCSIWPGQSAAFYWNLNIHFKISIIWKTTQYPNIFPKTSHSVWNLNSRDSFDEGGTFRIFLVLKCPPWKYESPREDCEPGDSEVLEINFPRQSQTLPSPLLLF